MRRNRPRVGQKQWHPELIKAAVRMRGENLSSLARSSGLQEDACRDALRTRRPEAEAVIAKYIGVPVHELWPDRYPEGERSTNVDNATPEVAHRQIVAVR